MRRSQALKSILAVTLLEITLSALLFFGGVPADLLVLPVNAEENPQAEEMETGVFSRYTVEFTYNDLQYVLLGDSSVALSEILDKVGLTGEASAVEVSDESLFYAVKCEMSADGKTPKKDADGGVAESENGEWVVVAHKAFSTTEWMKVTIDGVVYEITVTDTTGDVAASGNCGASSTPSADPGYSLGGVSYSYVDGEGETQNVTINPVEGAYTFEMPNAEIVAWNTDLTVDDSEIIATGTGGISIAATNGTQVIPKNGMTVKIDQGESADSVETAEFSDKITIAETDYWKKYTKIYRGVYLLTVIPPAAKSDLIYTGTAQELVLPGSVEGGTMQYALGDADGATESYTMTIPTGTDART